MAGVIISIAHFEEESVILHINSGNYDGQFLELDAKGFFDLIKENVKSTSLTIVSNDAVLAQKKFYSKLIKPKK